MSHSSRSTSTSERPWSSEPADHYAILGVPETAGTDQIRRAYRVAMKRAHPDRAQAADRPAAEARARAINDAYRTLTDPERRRRYDAERRADAVQRQIMNQYFGGFGVPGETDDLAERLRQAQRREQRARQRAHDRSATSSLLFVFGGLLLTVVTLILLWGILAALVDRALS